tara:strand:- start:116 stop:976 length:861 start_codon:yes stop_codon:yes gene_type:complete
MKTRFVMVTDFFFDEVGGGAEINAESLVDRFIEHGVDISKIKSSNATLEFLSSNKDAVFIFSNFILLKEECKQYAIKNLKYFVYEQDHKYIRSRNPVGYKDFIAPKSELTNIEFYNGAIKVMFLTKLSMDVFVANTGLTNVLNLGSSTWRRDELEYIRTICNTSKQDVIAIMDSNNPIKRTDDCVDYCLKRDLKYQLIRDRDFKKFLYKMSHFEKLLFLTGHLETCARIVVEAKMLNLRVITQKKLIGAASEDWYSLSGEELIDKMEEMSYNMPLRILEAASVSVG